MLKKNFGYFCLQSLHSGSITPVWTRSLNSATFSAVTQVVYLGNCLTEALVDVPVKISEMDSSGRMEDWLSKLISEIGSESICDVGGTRWLEMWE
jgi:hypothetical protein